MKDEVLIALTEQLGVMIKAESEINEIVKNALKSENACVSLYLITLHTAQISPNLQNILSILAKETVQKLNFGGETE